MKRDCLSAIPLLFWGKLSSFGTSKRGKFSMYWLLFSTYHPVTTCHPSFHEGGELEVFIHLANPPISSIKQHEVAHWATSCIYCYTPIAY